MAEAREYADLSQHVYGTGASLPPGWVVLPIPASETTNDVTGFAGTAYANTTTGEIVVAFRGTQDGKDTRSDLQIAQGRLPDQFGDALKLYQHVRKNYGTENTRITVTGHSLGGALAQLVAKQAGLSGETFGAPGVNNIPLNNPVGPGQVTNHVTSADPIGNFGKHVGTVNVVPAGSPLHQLLVSLLPLSLQAYYVYQAHAIDTYAKLFATASITRSPIALDLNGDGLATTGLQDGAYFDHDANGFAEQTGWVGPHDGLLVRDLNGNGTIDSGRELFGSETLLANGHKAAHGFEALAELDSNRDGQINAQDAAFATFKIWKDIDGNGYSSPDELSTLADAGIHSIATGYSTVNQTDAAGNTIQQTGAFTRADGSSGVTADIYFQVDNTNTIATDWLPETAAVTALPDLQGFGTVYNLHQAMLRDGSGRLQALVQHFANETDPAARHALMIPLLYAWAGVEHIDPASRSARLIYGNAIGDARKLATLEAFLGQPYLGTWCWGERDPNPHGPASRILLRAFDDLADNIYSQLMAQTHFQSLFDSIAVTLNVTTGRLDFDVSNTLAALQDRYVADPESSLLDISEFADVLKVAGEAGHQVLATLRAQGNVGGDGFAHLLGSLGLATTIGDAGHNTLRGSDQADVLFGLGGADNLYGNGGNDFLNGGTGNDYLAGGNGHDTYLFRRGEGHDIILDADATVGNLDVIQFGAGIRPADVTFTRIGYDLVLGIMGPPGTPGTADQLTIHSWGEAPTYRIERMEFADGTVWDAAQIQARIPALVSTEGDDTLFVWQGDPATTQGRGGHDTLYGNSGGNVLDGGAGNDWLDGGGGTDTLIGGTGNDTFVVDHAGDVVIENLNDGTDTVQSSISYILGDHVENLTLIGGNAINGTGNTLNNVLTGNNAANVLDGGAGADTISAGAGNDNLTGGAGTDLLAGNGGADTLRGGLGNDTLSEMKMAA